MLYLISISIRNAIPKRRILFRTAFTMRRPSDGCGWRFVADVAAPNAKVTPDDDRAMAVVDDSLRLCWAPPELQRSVVGSEISELAIRTEDLDELVGFALANHHPRYQTLSNATTPHKSTHLQLQTGGLRMDSLRWAGCMLHDAVCLIIFHFTITFYDLRRSAHRPIWQLTGILFSLWLTADSENIW